MCLGYSEQLVWQRVLGLGQLCSWGILGSTIVYNMVGGSTIFFCVHLVHRYIGRHLDSLPFNVLIQRLLNRPIGIVGPLGLLLKQRLVHIYHLLLFYFHLHNDVDLITICCLFLLAWLWEQGQILICLCLVATILSVVALKKLEMTHSYCIDGMLYTSIWRKEGLIF